MWMLSNWNSVSVDFIFHDVGVRQKPWHWVFTMIVGEYYLKLHFGCSYIEAWEYYLELECWMVSRKKDVFSLPEYPIMSALKIYRNIFCYRVWTHALFFIDGKDYACWSIGLIPLPSSVKSCSFLPTIFQMKLQTGLVQKKFGLNLIF